MPFLLSLTLRTKKKSTTQVLFSTRVHFIGKNAIFTLAHATHKKEENHTGIIQHASAFHRGQHKGTNCSTIYQGSLWQSKCVCPLQLITGVSLQTLNDQSGETKTFVSYSKHRPPTKTARGKRLHCSSSKYQPPAVRNNIRNKL